MMGSILWRPLLNQRRNINTKNKCQTIEVQYALVKRVMLALEPQTLRLNKFYVKYIKKQINITSLRNCTL